MTKADLIDSLSEKLGVPEAEAESAVDVMLSAITEALAHSERVNLSGFGTFTISARGARIGRNPKTGEAIEISAARSAKFKPGKQLKESLDGSDATDLHPSVPE